MECESMLFIKNQIPYLWDLSNSFSNSFIDFYSCVGFHQVIYQEEWSIKLCSKNGGWHESLNLLYVSRCEMLHFVDHVSYGGPRPMHQPIYRSIHRSIHRSIFDRVSVDTRSSIGRYIGRVSTDVLTDTAIGPYTWWKPVGRWFMQMVSKIPIWKFPFGLSVYHLNNRPDIPKEPRTSLTSSNKMAAEIRVSSYWSR